MYWRNPGWSCLLVVALILGWSCPVGAQNDGASALLDRGLTNWREGDLGAAIGLFEQALSADPTNDEVAEFLERATLVEVMRMVRSDDRRISGIGRTLLKMRRKEAQLRISDPDRLQEAVDETFAASGQKLLELKIRNASVYGRNLVPYIIARLADSEIETRVLAETWIVRIGTDAIPVLIAAAGHSDSRVRSAVAKLLGVRSIRHRFSAATLATMMTRDGDQGVRETARMSLMAIDGRPSENAREFHYRLARFIFTNPHQNPFNVSYYTPTIYHLRDDEVVGERVLGFQHSERLVGQALYQALKLDPGYQEAGELMLCNDAQMIVEYEEALELYADDAAAQEILASQSSTIEYVVNPRLGAAERSVLYGALGMALRDHNNPVATRLLETIRSTHRRGPTPRPMLAALTETTSRAVRVQAAAALAEWNPADLTPAVRDRVVSVLVEAVTAGGIRVAHKIMGHGDNVNRFDRLLREINVESFSNSKNVEAGLARADQLPPDLILIDDHVSSGVSTDTTPVNFLTRMLRKNPRTAEIPIVVVLEASRFDAQKGSYENEDDNVYVVPADIDVSMFRQGTVEPLFEDLDDAKTRALELGVLAAGALETLTRSGSPFPVERMVKNLERVLANRPDEIRIHCLGALGNLRTRALGSVGAISQIFTSTDNSVEIREGAMIAIGKILDAGTDPASAAVLKIIEDGMRESDIRLRRASYFAYSGARAPRDSVLQDLFDVQPPGESASE